MRTHRAGLLALLLTAACSSSSTSSPATTASGAPSATTATVPDPTTTTTAPVVLPPAAPIEWTPCGDGFDCATVTVPVDYAEPSGPTLDLALVRHPAGDATRRIGALLVNPGGPGASGVRRVRRGFEVSSEVGDRFDVIGFDPRGVGESEPVGCDDQVAAYRATDLAPDSPEEWGALETSARALARACRLSEGPRLQHLGTIAVARDVEMIRRALGEEQVSFVGLSYGTLVGQLWAEEHPASVRAMVLDGPVNPAASGATSSADQARAVEAVLQQIDDACAGDADCPIATTGFLHAYDELARRIEAGDVQRSRVGPTQLAYAAFYATYDADTWPRLWTAVATGLDGDLTAIGELADSYTRLVSYAPFAIVSCLDGPHPVGLAAWQAAGEAVDAASPRFGRQLANELLPCAFWPTSPYQPQRVEATGAPPILVVGSTGDAATPFDDAVLVAESLASGHLLTVEVAGHVAIGDSECATAAVTRYLVDLTLPAAGARC